ncbi:MAG: ABC transporter ATP-binding protein [Dehalococcoidia bacterium]
MPAERTAPAAAEILVLRGLRKYFQASGLAAIGRRRPPIRAVDGVDFTVRRGENFGLVGESGSGKTTIAKLILRLEPPTDGEILFEGEDVNALSGRALKDFRKATHVVFQDPNSSLSPRMRVADIVGEPLAVQGVRGARRRERVAEVLALVGLNPSAARRYPHEFSGGQRQRVAVARAIVAEPKLIVLDEPVSALDVSIRAQILNLLRDLQDRLNLTYVTIAHDLAVVYQACDTIGVMYLGKLVELAPSEALYREPRHPYTRILLSAIPKPDPRLRHTERLPLTGEIPSPAAPPPGCRFHPRCPIAVERCAVDEPVWRELEPGHWVACHLA